MNLISAVNFTPYCPLDFQFLDIGNYSCIYYFSYVILGSLLPVNIHVPPYLCPSIYFYNLLFLLILNLQITLYFSILEHIFDVDYPLNSNIIRGIHK